MLVCFLEYGVGREKLDVFRVRAQQQSHLRTRHGANQNIRIQYQHVSAFSGGRCGVAS